MKKAIPYIPTCSYPETVKHKNQTGTCIFIMHMFIHISSISTSTTACNMHVGKIRVITNCFIQMKLITFLQTKHHYWLVACV